MGVHLHFSSVEAVTPEVEQAIRAEAEQPAGPQPWVLCEPPHFDTTDEDGRLHGGSKLNLHPWADEWGSAANVQAERNDFQELLRRLTGWSARYGVSWELEVEGTVLGRIENGVCDPGVEGALESFADVGEYLAEEFPHEHPGPEEEPPRGPGLRIWREPEE